MGRHNYTAEHRRRAQANRRATRGTTTQRGYGVAYQRNRKACLDRDNYVCQLRMRGCTGVATTADHIVPTSAGGGHELTNLRAACGHCNYSRGAGPVIPAQRAARREWLAGPETTQGRDPSPRVGR